MIQMGVVTDPAKINSACELSAGQKVIVHTDGNKCNGQHLPAAVCTASCSGAGVLTVYNSKPLYGSRYDGCGSLEGVHLGDPKTTRRNHLKGG